MMEPFFTVVDVGFPKCYYKNSNIVQLSQLYLTSFAKDVDDISTL